MTRIEVNVTITPANGKSQMRFEVNRLCREDSNQQERDMCDEIETLLANVIEIAVQPAAIGKIEKTVITDAPNDTARV